MDFETRGGLVKVLFLAPNIRVPGTHGGSTHVLEVFSHLRKKCEDVMLIARRGSAGKGVVPVGIGSPPVVKWVLPAFYLPLVIRAAKRFGPDVIYERFSAYGLGAMLKTVLRKPLVTMVLDQDMHPLSLQLADKIVTTRPELIPSRYQYKTERVFWGFNPARFHPEVKGDHILKAYKLEGHYIVGYAGGFYPWHGLEVLPDVAEILKRHDVKFLLVGDGKVRKKLEEEVRHRGLEDSFVFTGRVPYERVPEYIAACDICFAVYDPSGHPEMKKTGRLLFDPLKVFEYLGMGKAVITTDSPNIRELYSDGVHLRMVPPGNAESIARVIEEILSDRDKAAAMAFRGREVTCEKFTWDRHVDHLLNVFREVRGGF